jgi:hypothetical protein
LSVRAAQDGTVNGRPGLFPSPNSRAATLPTIEHELEAGHVGWKSFGVAKECGEQPARWWLCRPPRSPTGRTHPRLACWGRRSRQDRVKLGVHAAPRDGWSQPRWSAVLWWEWTVQLCVPRCVRLPHKPSEPARMELFQKGQAHLGLAVGQHAMAGRRSGPVCHCDSCGPSGTTQRGRRGTTVCFVQPFAGELSHTDCWNRQYLVKAGSRNKHRKSRIDFRQILE